jgi:uncharacterized pyridoxamine 5'-phosphate oxidase family protein
MKMVAIVLLGLALAGPEADKCPISGKPAKDDIFLDVNGKKVHFCCDNCPKAYEKKIGLVDNGPAKCPLSGKDAKAETKLIHQKAEMVYFCCENCPKKYAEKEKLTAIDKGPKTCAACDKPANAEHSVAVNGEKVYFCCGNCQKSYLTKLGVVDKGPDKCPVSGHAAKKETGIVRIKSEAVYFCCTNCRGKYIEKNLKPKSDKID